MLDRTTYMLLASVRMQQLLKTFRRLSLPSWRVEMALYPGQDVPEFNVSFRKDGEDAVYDYHVRVDCDQATWNEFVSVIEEKTGLLKP